LWIFPSKSSSAIISPIVYIPSDAKKVTFPFNLGGTKIRCSSKSEFSKHDPKISPPVTIWPILIFLFGSKFHYLSKSKAGTSAPLGIKTLSDYLAITSRGLWIPSNICSRIPGPRQTDKGSFVLITGSPTVRPEVSS